ncbi:M48 family metalloprotease [Parapedomonas caeni]
MARLSLTFVLMASLVAMPGCTTNPATGKKDFTPFMSKSQERAIGLSEHPKLLKEFGGPYEDAAAGYVAQVGGTMARNSELAGDPFTFTLLNSRIVNAFALPGGYVYISRQLLALMNDEAELASVLGHEVGHVTGRHAAKRYNQQIFGGILGLGVGVLTGSGDLARAVGQGVQMYTLAYSRDQEFQADELGVRYLGRAGYDPHAAADMLSSLGAESALEAKVMGREAAEKVPTWARTHPLTGDRVARAGKLAAASGAVPGAGTRNRDRFLSAIDGLLVDDDPAQGFINGRVFEHPVLKMRFTVPERYVMENGDSALVAQGPNGAGLLFSGGQVGAGERLEAHIARVWQQLTQGQAAALPAARARQVNGIEAAVTGTRLRNSQGGGVDVTIAAYRWTPTQAYHFVTITPTEMSGQLDAGLNATLNSLRRLSDAEAAALKERRIKVVTVAAGQTAQQLAERMAYDSHRLERFLTLNALDRPEQLKAGQKAKLVVYDKRR